MNLKSRLPQIHVQVNSWANPLTPFFNLVAYSSLGGGCQVLFYGNVEGEKVGVFPPQPPPPCFCASEQTLSLFWLRMWQKAWCLRRPCEQNACAFSFHIVFPWRYSCMPAQPVILSEWADVSVHPLTNILNTQLSANEKDSSNYHLKVDSTMK